MFYFGDALNYFEHHSTNFVTVSLHKTKYDPANSMYYSKPRWMDKKTKIFNTSTIIGKAGFVPNSENRQHYVIWTGMVLQIDSKPSLCGNLKLL
jgi:hypothetical protein